MADQNSPIDVYYDMDIAQICQHFNKTRNTVDKAVAKLVKNYPDKGWKYKNPQTKRITIKAEGVEVLSTYFRKEKHEISTVEAELRSENEKLTILLQEKEKALEEKNKTIESMENLYAERLKLELDKRTHALLLEQKTKDDEFQESIDRKESKIQSLESENKQLKSEAEEAKKLAEEIQEYKRKEEEYNSKSFFYRLTHKFNA